MAEADELAALGVTVSDERTQESRVLGARLASGAGLAPPLQIPKGGEGEWVSIAEADLFPQVAVDRLLELARGAANAAKALRGSVGAVGDACSGATAELAVGVLRAALRFELGETAAALAEEEPPPRRNKKEHRLICGPRCWPLVSCGHVVYPICTAMPNGSLVLLLHPRSRREGCT